MPLPHHLTSATRWRQRRLTLLGRVQEAEDDHDRTRRQTHAGVTHQMLEADKARWTGVGIGIAALARTVRDACAASAFFDAHPQIDLVTARLSDAIDDQFDREAWILVDAAAHLAASEP